MVSAKHFRNCEAALAGGHVDTRMAVPMGRLFT